MYLRRLIYLMSYLISVENSQRIFTKIRWEYFYQFIFFINYYIFISLSNNESLQNLRYFQVSKKSSKNQDFSTERKFRKEKCIIGLSNTQQSSRMMPQFLFIGSFLLAMIASSNGAKGRILYIRIRVSLHPLWII